MNTPKFKARLHAHISSVTPDQHGGPKGKTQWTVNRMEAMQDMNVSTTEDHKALPALAVAKIHEQPRAEAPPTNGRFYRRN